jgi:hypothetical protein
MLQTCFPVYFSQPWRLTPILYALNISQQCSCKESSLTFITKGSYGHLWADQSRINGKYWFKNFIFKFTDYNKNTTRQLVVFTLKLTKLPLHNQASQCWRDIKSRKHQYLAMQCARGLENAYSCLDSKRQKHALGRLEGNIAII